MASMIVELEWDEEELGPQWMNIDNLKLCLYSQEHTLKDLVQVTELAQETHSTPYDTEPEESIENIK